jgi:hypothetical protein
VGLLERDPVGEVLLTKDAAALIAASAPSADSHRLIEMTTSSDATPSYETKPGSSLKIEGIVLGDPPAGGPRPVRAWCPPL